MTLSSEYDAFLFDLDGTVWEGGTLLPHAADAINALTGAVEYVTNNASRSPQTVAEMLTHEGIPTSPDQIMTSAQAAIELAAMHLRPGDKVLVLGASSFKDLVRESGYTVVDSADRQPKVVLHGHNPDTGWRDLSEAALAINNGAKYIASNLDSTLPSERGLLVGNGSMVQAVVSATGVVPESAGKPAAAMFELVVDRIGSKRPLAIGDRLNTDIAGAVAANVAALHVLTGVSKHWALLRAPKEYRPTYIAADLSGLMDTPEELVPGAQGGFIAELQDGNIVISGGHANGDNAGIYALRTALAIAWSSPESFSGEIITQSPAATQAVEEWL